MAPRLTVTTNELLDALAQSVSNGNSEGALTTKELAAHLDTSVYIVKKKLHELDAEGRLVCHKVERPALGGGRVSRVPAYTVKPAA